MNRTVLESLRSVLSHSELSHEFMAEALSTAVYLRNRSPIKSLGNVTPYEALYGLKLDVSHFKVFGCVSYAHVPKEEMGKL